MTNLIPWQPGMSLVNASGDINPTSLGYQYAIQTTQLLRPKVISQKFYEVPIADFVPVIIGDGAWMDGMFTNLQYDAAGDFESGIIDKADPSNLAQVNVGVAPIPVKIMTWAKGYQYSVPEMQKALAAGKWDVVAGKLSALKRNWDLGIQKIAFLGMKVDPTGVPGLLSNTSVTVNTTLITGPVKLFTTTQFSAFVSNIMGVYFSNTNSTTMPNRLIMPMQDFLGLSVPVSSQFPNVSMGEYLRRAFAETTGNADFKIQGLAYSDQSVNAGYWASGGTNRYVLYRYDAETVRLDIPVDFNYNAPGTRNNFNFEGVGYGQFTGTQVYRPAEVMYFDYAS